MSARRMAILIGAICGAGTAAPPNKPPAMQREISTNVLQALQRARFNYVQQKRDPFFRAERDPAIGQAFSLKFFAQSDQVNKGDHTATWFVNGDSLVIAYNNWGETPEYVDGDAYAHVIVKSYGHLDKVYRAQNAFGASTNVFSRTDSLDKVYFARMPKGEEHDPTGSLTLKADQYWVRVALDRDGMRALARDSALVIEGVVIPFPNGRSSTCSEQYHVATFTDPTNLRGLDCAIATAVTRVAFIRASTGEIIKEWR